MNRPVVSIPIDGLPSPDGRFMLRTNPWEARMSLWVCPPELEEVATGREVLRLAETAWSADGAVWESGDVLVLHLRRYPGDHRPGKLEVAINVADEHATVQGRKVPLVELEQTLNGAVHPR